MCDCARTSHLCLNISYKRYNESQQHKTKSDNNKETIYDT